MTKKLENNFEEVKKLIEEGKNNIQIVRELANFGIKTTEASVRRLIDKKPELQELSRKNRTKNIVESYAEPSGTVQEGDTLVVTLEPGKQVDKLQIDDILKRRNLDPDEWEVKQILDNQWEANAGSGTKITLFQFKIWLSKKVPLQLVFPAQPKLDIKLPESNSKSSPTLAVVCGDHQAPYHDKNLHNVFLQWLVDNKPDIGIINGDVIDWNPISRHREDPAWPATVQEGIQSAFDIIYDYRLASPDTEWTLISGNHDAERIRNYVLEKADKLYNITPAQYPGDKEPEWVFSLNHLLRLEELGVKYKHHKGAYEFEQVILSDLLSVRHGKRTGQDASLKTAIDFGNSVVLGHTHSQSVKKKTVWNSITKEWKVLTAIESGCMCDIVGGIGFASQGVPDWQQGFCSINLHDDEMFQTDLASFTFDKKLYWRNKVYSAE